MPSPTAAARDSFVGFIRTPTQALVSPTSALSRGNVYPAKARLVAVRVWILRTVAAAHGLPLFGVRRSWGRAAVTEPIERQVRSRSSCSGRCQPGHHFRLELAVPSLLLDWTRTYAHRSTTRNRALATRQRSDGRRPLLCRSSPQTDASTRTTSAHVAARKMAMSAKAPAKPAPIPAQSRPDGSVLTAGCSRSPSLMFPLLSWKSRCVVVPSGGRGSKVSQHITRFGGQGCRCRSFSSASSATHPKERQDRDDSRYRRYPKLRRHFATLSTRPGRSVPRPSSSPNSTCRAARASSHPRCPSQQQR